MFAGSEKWLFGGGMWWLPFTMEIVHIFHSGYFDYKVVFWTAVDKASQILQFSEDNYAI